MSERYPLPNLGLSTVAGAGVGPLATTTPASGGSQTVPWCQTTTNYDWTASGAHPAGAFFLQWRRSSTAADGGAGLWLNSSFLDRHPGGPYILGFVATETGTASGCPVPVQTLPMCGTGPSDQYSAIAHHGPAHLTNGAFSATVVDAVVENLLGYSYDGGEQNNPCTSSANPMEFFDTAPGCD